MASSSSFARSPSFPFVASVSAATISSKLSPANHPSMAARRGATSLGTAWSCVSNRLSTFPTTPAASDLLTSASAVASSFTTLGTSSDASVCVANPKTFASKPLSLLPVSASIVPNSPCTLLRKCVPPTSGTSPMAHSGIDRTVRSVAHRCEPFTETPQPPPITMPSMSATCGVVKRPRNEFMTYSAAKKESASAKKESVFECVRISYIRFTSPPAHRQGRSPAPRTTMAFISGSASERA
mmetsp:Transcript_8217/g.37437  ORF Transcript_8217/g.37437 Transcript_8217/m.37437 type:complete len:240 (-) Transcript_8217:893-1612(-)